MIAVLTLYFLIGFVTATCMALFKKNLSGEKFVQITLMWFMYVFELWFGMVSLIAIFLADLASKYIKFLKKLQGTNEK